MQYIVMYSSREIYSPFNEWLIVWLLFVWETQYLLEWHTPQNKNNKIESFAKNIIATRVYMHFLPYLLINYSISWCILQINSIPYSMKGESYGFDYFWRHSRFLNDIPPHCEKNHYYTSLHAFFTILINKLQYIVMYSSRQFNSLSNEGRIVWLR